ncbi:tyrosine-type recombinase/integrase [Gallibacter intestinalis]|uniref:Site-specific integrase n=1 Tax=Gallibacter intestinalis TaxID=2779356 RepID=A0ABR9QXB0_9FIRM|nr:tyrosine-type recombinase/integrase [Gallibacter intestinalis]MBE5035523.1 site-specific integrase [Gallibacter intestinalis]
MSKKRRDNKGRILHNGEMQMSDGKYRYKYINFRGEEKVVYSWRLTRHDPIDPTKKKTLSLREIEMDIQRAEFDGLTVYGDNMSVLELVEKYTTTRIGVRPTTKRGYGTVINLLKKEDFGYRRIDKIRISDAKYWLIKLQQKDGKSYSVIHNIRGVLRPAFQMAVDDDLIKKNPFNFPLVDVVVNDSVRREALTQAQERKFLQFVKEDKHFKKYYEGIYILFKTGLRISEFCGLTVSDIDFKNHILHIKRQLQKNSVKDYYIEAPKSKSGYRKIPMTKDVEDCFKKIIENRNPPKIEPMVDGVAGFLYFDQNGSIVYSLHWSHYFKRIWTKYNNIYREPMPKVTPHVCRHTFCSNMAKAGMNPKALQYIMGHSDISVTLNTYTHFEFEDAKKELEKLG